MAVWQSPAHMPRARTGAAQHFEFLLIAPLSPSTRLDVFQPAGWLPG